MKDLIVPMASIKSSYPSLRLMINQVYVKNLISEAPSVSITNDVSESVHVMADQKMLSGLLGKLMLTVILQSGCKSLNLSSKCHGDVVLIRLKYSSQKLGETYEERIQDLDQMANILGGNVQITSCRHNVTTIALTFLNLPVQSFRPDMTNLSNTVAA